MSRDPLALIFKRLAVRRMPGIDDGGFELDGLAPGINIIHGPNASGKTTTARALESLIWPRAAAPASAHVIGHFYLDGREWGVDLDGDRAEYQRDGQDADPPALPSGEVRDRYQLSLHELLSAENRALADEVVRESVGGYDLSKAESSLHIRTNATRRGAEARALADAETKLREARAAEVSLQQEERRLIELEADEEAAKAAAVRAQLLEKAVEYAEARAAVSEGDAAIAAYPEALRDLRGDEAERLTSIRAARVEAEHELAKARAELVEAERVIAEAALPGDGVDDAALATLRSRLNLIRNLEGEITARRRDLHGAQKAAGEELRRIDEIADAERLRELDIVRIDELATFAEEAGKARARLHAAEARRRVLTSEPADKTIDSDRIGRGILLLQQWLRTTGPSAGPESANHGRRVRLIGVIGAGLLAVIGLAGILFGPGIGLGLGTGPALTMILAGIVLLTLILRPAPAAADPSREYRRDYERLGLESPRTWEDDDVAATLSQLETLRAQAHQAEERRRELSLLAPELEEVKTIWEALEERRAELAERFGVTPDLDPATFYLLANRINRWQDSERTVVERSAELERLEGEHHDALTAAAERLADFGYEKITDLAELEGAIEGLNGRIQRHRSASTDRHHAETRVRAAEREIDELETERLEIFERCGLTPGEDSGEDAGEDAGEPASRDPEDLIREWCRHYESYTKAVEERQSAEAVRRGAHERLTRATGYEPGLEDREIAELQAELEEVTQIAARAGEISESITRIRVALENAREGHAVEDALARVEQAEEALRALRDRDILGVVGNELVEFLKRATHDVHRPPVFNRAKELFSQITNHRYRLDFDDGSPPAFRAVETTTDRGHSLDELSSGTRVQLLLAVRLAFVESQETGPRLPLIFDETLGNSDDVRAAAIMQATLALAAAGRQVFYFTAQPDEVGKWRGLLERSQAEGAQTDSEDDVVPHVEWAILDLAEARKLARHKGSPPLPVVTPPELVVPSPEGLSHDDYGRLLLVPGLDPFMEPTSVHLWHLVDDPGLLHRLLTRGLESWGALRALAEHGGRALLGDDSDAFEAIAAAARALETALELARIGLGRPIDRTVIEASGAVTKAFMERALDLLDEVDGDAARLIEQIEGGAISGFYTSQREKLHEYLEEHDYLDPREPIGPEEFRARVLAEVAGEIEVGDRGAGGAEGSEAKGSEAVGSEARGSEARRLKRRVVERIIAALGGEGR